MERIVYTSTLNIQAQGANTLNNGVKLLKGYFYRLSVFSVLKRRLESMGMYFSKYKFEMDFGYSPQSKAWTTRCNGKQVKGLDGYICSCRVDDDLVLQVVKPWCVRGYYRRHTLANYKRKHDRPSK